MEGFNVNTAGYNGRAFIGCILIIALTFHGLPRTVVYTQNVPLTAYLNPASCFAEKVRALKSWQL